MLHKADGIDLASLWSICPLHNKEKGKEIPYELQQVRKKLIPAPCFTQ
jgi:hypothetical protein